MKYLQGLCLSGFLLLLISNASAQVGSNHGFSKDSTLSAPSSVPGKISTTTNLKDTLPYSQGDTVSRAASGFQEKDSIPRIKDSMAPVAKTLLPGGGSGRRSGNGRQSAPIGHFYGRIVDTKSNKGLEGTSVQLIMSIFDVVKHIRRDSVIRGAITPSNGDFSFENLPILGSYQFEVNRYRL